MSTAVRSTSSAQGSGLTASGGSSSRGAPADGTSFGGVLGAAMSGPPQAPAGAGDGKAGGKNDKQSDSGQNSPPVDPTTVLADLAPNAGGALSNASAASGSKGGGAATLISGIGTSAAKKRTSDTTSNPTATDPRQAAQAAVLIAIPLTPASGPAATPRGAVANAAVSAATGTPEAANGPSNARPGKSNLRVLANPSSTNSASASGNNQLGEPVDGTGSREPDGIDSATAAVGRPAALISSGLAGSLPANASAVSRDHATADSAAAPASGSLDGQSVTTGVSNAGQTTVAAPTVVFAALASGEREPSRDPSASGNVAPPVGVTGTVSTNVSLAMGTVASVAPAAASAPSSLSAAANTGVNVLTSDGGSQPLANALGSQVLAMVSAGRSQVTVHLSPPDLGNLTVRVEVQSHDVSAWFASPQPQVQQAVNDALAQLHGSLSGAGLNLSGAWVGADVSGGGNGRPPLAPPPVRRVSTISAGGDPAASGTTSIEGLSVYA